MSQDLIKQTNRKPKETFKEYLERIRNKGEPTEGEPKPTKQTKRQYKIDLSKENWSNSSEREI